MMGSLLDHFLSSTSPPPLFFLFTLCINTDAKWDSQLEKRGEGGRVNYFEYIHTYINRTKEGRPTRILMLSIP
ncbi:hypothetical protein BDV26DRAFT_236695 [Aspergillus bertholletiae]|uniref:Uncharacterized protein n=1 Tax=Aspergillus bertholletiae TaxID=1226010 RepID=A0A5N7BL78_9EURO|nr:hypothetical protein BDV26DRAFT_236695 [Aspergillus bertholletiae]